MSESAANDSERRGRLGGGGEGCGSSGVGAPSAATGQRFTERGAECRQTHVEGYTGPICSCPPMTCRATKDSSEQQEQRLLHGGHVAALDPRRDRRTEYGEPLYTIEEARRELAILECAKSGHSYDVLTAMGGNEPLRVFCTRCDKTWAIAG